MASVEESAELIDSDSWKTVLFIYGSFRITLSKQHPRLNKKKQIYNDLKKFLQKGNPVWLFYISYIQNIDICPRDIHTFLPHIDWFFWSISNQSGPVPI